MSAAVVEPTDVCRDLHALEPSDVMAAQRAADRAPAIRASAAQLPLRDGSVDAAMTVLSLHHWDDGQERGVKELRRVARGPVVIVAFEPAVCARMWLTRDYLPEVAELDQKIAPSMAQLTRWLSGNTRVEVLPVPRDTPDWTLMSFWAHPKRVLDEVESNSTSGFARMPVAVVQRVIAAVDVTCAMAAGNSETVIFGSEYDAGMRLVVNLPA